MTRLWMKGSLMNGAQGCIETNIATGREGRKEGGSTGLRKRFSNHMAQVGIRDLLDAAFLVI